MPFTTKHKPEEKRRTTYLWRCIDH